MRDWDRSRDVLLRQLREHAADCQLCDLAYPGAQIHNECDAGIVLLTEWHIAKCYAKELPTLHPQHHNREAKP